MTTDESLTPPSKERRAGIEYPGVGIGVVLVNEKGEILVMQRDPNSRNEPFLWDCPGGAVEFGQTLFEAAQEEMRQELDIEIEALPGLIARWQICNWI